MARKIHSARKRSRRPRLLTASALSADGLVWRSICLSGSWEGSRGGMLVDLLGLVSSVSVNYEETTSMLLVDA